jgi:hypothetical protein
MIRRLLLAIVLSAGLGPAFAQAPAPVPALPDTERRTSYSITASTCACAVGMQMYQDNTDISAFVEVFLNGVKVAYNDTVFGWTITVPTGSLATRARPISDAVLTFNSAQTGTVQIVGAQRPRRLTEVSESRGVAARDFNLFANATTAELREVWDRFLRTPRVPAGETLAMLPPLSGRANMNACWDAGGNLNSCVGSSSGSFAAGPGITFTGTNPTTISVAVAANPTTVAVSSRTVAQTLDLHAYSVVTTGGYGSGADGGGATLKNIGSAAFQDTYITAATIAGGSGYTNGTYNGVGFGGGTGLGCAGSLTVSGNVVVSVSLVVPCATYQVGDVLTTPNSAIGGTGSGFTYTVTSMSVPTASFTDSVGAHFQYVIDGGNYANVKQFGCMLDWNGVDGSATNNYGCLLSALAFASIPASTSITQVNGNTVLIPKGGIMYCGGKTLPIPQGVALKGMGVGATTLKQCSADPSSIHSITLCDPNAQFGQYACSIRDMTIIADGSSDSGIAAIYSNSGQQFPLAENLEIQPHNRGCLYYEIGKGGAANAIFNNIDCEGAGTANNDGAFINSSSTIAVLENWVFGCAPTACTRNAIHLAKGALIANKIHIEGTTTGIFMQNANNDLSQISNITGAGNGCTTLITLASTDSNNTAVYWNIDPAGCTTTVTNGHSGGSSVTGKIVLPRVFNP